MLQETRRTPGGRWEAFSAQYLAHVKGELAGGFAAAMVALPSSIIFGLIAFAPLGPDYAGPGILSGLYAAVFAGFIVPICGGTQGMIVGARSPALLVFSAVIGQLLATGTWSQAPTSDSLTVLTLSFCMVFLSGVMQVVFGVLRFGNLVKYISYPVIAGVLNGTTLMILKGAIWGVLGISPQPLSVLLTHFDQIQPLTVAIALTSTLLWLKGEQYVRHVPGAVFSLLGGGALYYGLQAAGFGASIGGTMAAVSSSFLMPGSMFGFLDIRFTPSLQHVIPLLLSGALTIAILNSVDSLLAMLTLQNLTHVRGNSNRELIGHGLGNMVNALFGALPAGGGIGRVTTNYKAGGRTRLSGLFCSIVTLLVILLGASYIRFIPQAVIAGMTVMVGLLVADKWCVQLVKRAIQKEVGNRRELLLNLAVMLVVMGTMVLFNIVTAVAVGIAVSAFMLLVQMSRSIIRNIHSGSKIHSKRQRAMHAMEGLRKHGDQIAIVELEGPIFFGATDTLVQTLDDLVSQRRRYLIVDLKRVTSADVSGARVLVQTYTQLRQKGATLLFSYLYPGSSLLTFLHDLDLFRTVQGTHVFVDTDQALEYCEDCLLKDAGMDLTPEAIVVLREVLGLTDVSSDELRALNAYMTQETFKAGELLCRQGDPGDSMYIIAQGVVDVTIPLPGEERKKRLATLGYGTIFGEMALLDHEKRSATGEVRENLVCYKISTEAMQHLKRDYPRLATVLLETLCRVLAGRVRHLTETVGELER